MTRNRIFKTTNMFLLGLFVFAFLSPNALTAQVSTADLLGTVTDPSGGASFVVKLWDGTTVMAAGQQFVSTGDATVALSGYITSPAGNIRMTVGDVSSTSGVILAAVSAATIGRASVITGIRIG